MLWLLTCGGSAGCAASTSTDGAGLERGAAIFDAQCALCHGRDGRLGLSGAKDLTGSTLDRDQVVGVIMNGRGAMMAYGKVLTPEEVQAVADHVLALRAVR
ncbi:MAG: cytochrome c [Flavobacteriales bacterium]|nr:cytochrome c [Flavobacteriales bacterium]MCB9193420.1 cytochrome c [Flavobacteriales bacterium]